jgi:beta-lactamase regulating signal transducer with metallopeptidase domain
MATKINPFPHQLTQQAARNVEEVNCRNESLEAEINQLNPSLQINQNKNIYLIVWMGIGVF